MKCVQRIEHFREGKISEIYLSYKIIYRVIYQNNALKLLLDLKLSRALLKLRFLLVILV